MHERDVVIPVDIGVKSLKQILRKYIWLKLTHTLVNMPSRLDVG